MSDSFEKWYFSEFKRQPREDRNETHIALMAWNAAKADSELFRADMAQIVQQVFRLNAENAQLRAAQAQAGDGEAVGWRFKKDGIDYGITCYDEDKYKSYIESGWTLVGRVYTAPPAAVVNRQDLIDLLIATRTQSEGITADLIIKMLDDTTPPAVVPVNQQLLESREIKPYMSDYEQGCVDGWNNYRDAIAAAQEQK